ncbi:MAG: translation initiation factor IF-2 N-terminal domain-containing protein, partial [Solirubrobacteraceae bacterium]
MKKRVHEIAKERGMPAKDLLARLRDAGIEVKAASSSIEEATAARVLGNGDGPKAAPAPAPSESVAAAPSEPRRAPAPDGPTASPARPASSPQSAP